MPTQSRIDNTNGSYRLDALTERRVSWRHWAAEVGGHHKPTPVAIPEKPKTLDQPRSVA